MAVISNLLGMIFGKDRNVLRETVEVFRENAEHSAQRENAMRAAALSQFSVEFRPHGRSGFDQLMDGINRLPRPMLALGTCALFGAAMGDPVWFATRMQGLAQVPQPLWWLLGVIVSFYFGARHQIKAQDFQRQMAAAAAQGLRLHQTGHEDADQAEETKPSRRGLSVLLATTGTHAKQTLAVTSPVKNPALTDWRRRHQAAKQRAGSG